MRWFIIEETQNLINEKEYYWSYFNCTLLLFCFVDSFFPFIIFIVRKVILSHPLT